MNALDSPLEALTFAPVNLGTVISSIANNLWAWLAVITATLSIWRLRTTKTTPPLISLSPPPSPPPTKPKTTTITTGTASFQCTDINQMREKVKEAEEEEALSRGNSKKFFTVYFEERENINNQLLEEEEEEEEEDDHNDGHDDKVESRGVMVIKTWGSSSQLRMKKRGGDFGWYDYQNRKVIDGSVVRLWEEERETASPRICPSRRTAAASVLA